MSASIQPINPTSREILDARGEQDLSWEKLPEAKRTKAQQKMAVAAFVLEQAELAGMKPTTYAQYLLEKARAGKLDDEIMLRMLQGKNGKPVDRATLHRWLKRYREQGMLGLVDKRGGSKRKEYGWEARAIHLYQQPSRPAMSTVAHWLREEGWDTATYSRVRSYLNSLPTHVTTSAPARVGRHYHKQNLAAYKHMDYRDIPVGFIYQGDGHTCDVYVQHPATGNPFRPELTIWMDVRSQYVTGWWLSESESAVTTIFSLSHAIVSHDHVPDFVHTDPGPGFRNREVKHPLTGYLARLGIEHRESLPGNAKGKGIVERFFGIFEERCGKKFETYCGWCRTDDLLNRFQTKVRRGEVKVPTLEQYRDEVRRFIDAYNDTVHKEGHIKGHAPSELWAKLERVPVELPAVAIVRPRAVRVVHRESVRHDNRTYRHKDLAAFQGKKVIVEYDLHDSSYVVIRDLEGRFICDALLVEGTPVLQMSRLEERKRKRLEGQMARRRIKDEEDERRAAMAYDDKNTERLVASLEAANPALDSPEVAASGEIEIDLTTTDY